MERSRVEKECKGHSTTVEKYSRCTCKFLARRRNWRIEAVTRAPEGRRDAKVHPVLWAEVKATLSSLSVERDNGLYIRIVKSPKSYDRSHYHSPASASAAQEPVQKSRNPLHKSP